MIALDIHDSDIRTYVESLLSMAGLELVTSDQPDGIHVTDAQGYKYIKNKDLAIIIGESADLENLDPRRCMTLPVRAGALIDKIRTLQSAAQSSFPECISIGPYKFFPIPMILQNEDTGIEVKLTEKERDLLFFLHTQNGEVASRQTILQKLWGYADGVETHTLETHFYRLRQKMEKDPAKPELLITSDAGYVLRT